MVFIGDYAADAAHPNDEGNQIICDFINYYFDNAAAAEKSPEYALPETPVYGRNYAELKNIRADSEEITSLGSFAKDSIDCFTYDTCFRHDPADGNDPLTFTADFSKLLVAVRQNSAANLGTAEIWIDGEKAGEISCYSEGGWGNIETKLIYNQSESAAHTVEIKMSEDSQEK